LKFLNSFDFSSIENKDRIRRIIIDELGIDEEIRDYYFDPLVNNVQNRLNEFRTKFPEPYLSLFQLTKTGLGVGEILLYFLCDNLTLSGFSSQVDLCIDGKPFAEVKSVIPLNQEGLYGDIRFGAWSSIANLEFLREIKDFVTHSFYPNLIVTELEISSKKLDEIRKIRNEVIERSIELKLSVNGNVRTSAGYICDLNDSDFETKIRQLLSTSMKNPVSYQEIEDKFISNILDINSAGNEKFLCFNRKTGECIYFGKLTKDMMTVDRVTQGKIKPRLDLSSSLTKTNK